MNSDLQAVKEAIRDIPDFPKPGIMFKDITPVLSDADLFQSCISLLAERVKASGATKIAGLDARGFIFGAAVADRLKIGFVPIRKAGKLPYETCSVSYDLEYGSNTLEMHKDAVSIGEKVAIVDDLLATGGTAGAAIELLNEADIVGAFFVLELGFLKGQENLIGVTVDSLIVYD